MKKVLAAAALLLALCAYAMQGCAQIGFAEVKRENVNMRAEPSGKVVTRLDSPQSVYIVGEKTVGGQLWCHVYTYVGKNPREGWIRADMLRMLSEEFTGVTSVEAGRNYVLGLREDGTVAIMGDDMPHSPCLASVRSWTDMAQVCSYSVSVHGLTKSGVIRAAGIKAAGSAGLQAARIGGAVGFPIDENGAFMREAWYSRVSENTADDMDSWLEGLRVQEIFGGEITPHAVLTEDGRVVVRENWAGYGLGAQKGAFVNGPYVDLDSYFGLLAALRADGRVDATGYVSAGQEAETAAACETGAWTDVVKVEAGLDFVLGLRRDGTVYFAGADERHAGQVRALRNVADVAAGARFTIALLEDGSVVMTGEYSEEYFR